MQMFEATIAHTVMAIVVYTVDMHFSVLLLMLTVLRNNFMSIMLFRLILDVYRCQCDEPMT